MSDLCQTSLSCDVAFVLVAFLRQIWIFEKQWMHFEKGKLRKTDLFLNNSRYFPKKR